jgi:leader peptidase (prepilin peptidase) / N-methyltransferase
MINFFYNVYYFLSNVPWVFWTLVVLLALIIGSFLNLVIYRLPIMLENEWKKEGFINKYLLSWFEEKPFNLAFPSSHCPKCKHPIAIWDNIPIVSFLILRGKCRYCKTPIAIRYPLVEILSCWLSVLVAWHFGLTWQTFFLLPLTWSLIALAFIDIEHLILPDIITIPGLWIGLISNLNHLFATPKDAILGAIFGYIFLWVAAKIFKIIRGIEGMGQGDFKLLALFGAWCGWQLLSSIILLAAGLGVIVGGLTLLWKKYSFKHPIPFGPFIAISGWIALMWGTQILHWQSMIFRV